MRLKNKQSLSSNNIIFILGLALPAFFVFRAFFNPGPLVWGDAPYFFSEGLKELVGESYSWTSRGSLGGINDSLWLYPLMLSYGLLHKVFGFGNDIIIRFLFYFPAVILSFATPLLFTRYLKLSRTVQFFAALLYGLNTYFILLVDGGQVGIALAYGLFPLTLLYLRKLVDRPSLQSFYFAAGALFLQNIADVRIGLISVLTLVAWVLVERKAVRNLRYLILLGIAIAGLSSYWLVPTLKLVGDAAASSASRLQLLSLLNPLLLFQPHWPNNIFGQVSPPPFYFAGIPLLLFGSLLFSSRGRPAFGWAFLFLIFAFLAKGTTPPLGGIYEWGITALPFGEAFRDPTKFFAPLLLFGGILIGTTVNLFKSRAAILVVFFYLLFLIYPALLGEMKGVLAGRDFPNEMFIVKEQLSQEEGFFRSAWFPERHPLAFHTEENPSLDAKGLVDKRPLASLNTGTFDRFNYMHQEEFLDWYRLFGIKYLLFSDDPRKHSLNEEEQEEWNNLLDLASNINGLEPVNWNTGFPVYQVPDIKPRVFAADKLVAVVGSDDIYRKLRSADANFSPADQPFVFFEGGKLDPRKLEGLSPDSAILVFNDKDETDLTMSFLQEHFASVGEADVSQWAVRGADDYLRWKYEFLINDIETSDFDYGKGVAFSTVAGEEISWKLDIPFNGKYILATRVLENNVFSWEVQELQLSRGAYPLTLKNDDGFKAVNAVALVPIEDWNKAQQLTSNFIGHFRVVKLGEGSGVGELAQLLGNVNWQEINYEKSSPTRYELSLPGKGWWVVFTDSYHSLWQVERDRIELASYPFYSTINGFYINRDWDKAELVFAGQQEARWGVYWTLVSLLSLSIIFLWFYPPAGRAGPKKR